MRRLFQRLRSGRGLSAFAAVTLAWMIFVVLEGAVVRATGSGAGCGNHWPLCNGEVFPTHPRLATVIEFAHRSITAVCTALVAVLIAWTFLAQAPGARARKAALWSGLLLLTEALLGAVLVLGGYVEHNASDARVLVQCVHFSNTLLLLGALSLAWWWQRPRPPLSFAAAAPRGLALGAIALMVLTGATGSVAALADTLFPSTSLRSALLADLAPSSPLLIRMRWMHPAASTGVFLLTALLAMRIGRQRGRVLWALLASQLLLGLADVLTLAPTTLQVAHLLGADLLWIALVVTASDVVQAARAHSPRHQPATTSGALEPHRI